MPHGRHVHGLHPRGGEILEELFPGFADRVVADGGVSCDALASLRLRLWGHQLRQVPLGLPALLTRRPFLEGRIRALIREIPGVSILDGHSADGLEATADRRGIAGAQIRDPSGADGSPCPSQGVAADLIVDATGRGSRTALWLEDLGYQPPAEDRVEIGLGYSTRNYRLRPGALNGDSMILHSSTPANPRTGIIAATEGGRHIVTLAGICGDYPPTDQAGFDAFAATLAFPDIPHDSAPGP